MKKLKHVDKPLNYFNNRKMIRLDVFMAVLALSLIPLNSYSSTSTTTSKKYDVKAKKTLFGKQNKTNRDLKNEVSEEKYYDLKSQAHDEAAKAIRTKMKTSTMSTAEKTKAEKEALQHESEAYKAKMKSKTAAGKNAEDKIALEDRVTEKDKEVDTKAAAMYKAKAALDQATTAHSQAKNKLEEAEEDLHSQAATLRAGGDKRSSSKIISDLKKSDPKYKAAKDIHDATDKDAHEKRAVYRAAAGNAEKAQGESVQLRRSAGMNSRRMPGSDAAADTAPDPAHIIGKTPDGKQNIHMDPVTKQISYSPVEAAATTSTTTVTPPVKPAPPVPTAGAGDPPKPKTIFDSSTTIQDVMTSTDVDALKAFTNSSNSRAARAARIRLIDLKQNPNSPPPAP